MKLGRNLPGFDYVISSSYTTSYNLPFGTTVFFNIICRFPLRNLFRKTAFLLPGVFIPKRVFAHALNDIKAITGFVLFHAMNHFFVWRSLSYGLSSGFYHDYNEEPKPNSTLNSVAFTTGLTTRFSLTRSTIPYRDIVCRVRDKLLCFLPDISPSSLRDAG